MTTMQAFVTDGDGRGSVKSVLAPVPSAGEILVRVHYAALNPADWRIVEGSPVIPPAPKGLVCGCDFAGIVADANGSNWENGQRVAGFIWGGLATSPDRGAFAEYVAVEASLVYAIPDNISFQEASTIPLTYATATQALLQHLDLPDPFTPTNDQKDLLVYGASTSVGLYAVQLGKLGGLRVIAVASRRNHDLLKSLGAAVCVDYREEDWIHQVKVASQGKLQYALDCIAEGGTSEKVVQTLSQSQGDHYVGISALDKDSIAAANPHVKAESMIAFTVFGKTLGINGFDNERKSAAYDRQAWEEYLRWLPDLLGKDKLKPNVVKEMGGLENIQEALGLSKAGKFSAEKAVFRVV